MKIKTILLLSILVLMPQAAFASNNSYVEAYVLDTIHLDA